MVKNKLSLINNWIRPIAQPPRNGQILVPKQTYATYHVEDANAMKSSHEQAQVNPLLPKKNGETFQHPNFCRNKCNHIDCQHKLCPKLCDTLVTTEYIGHGTHDGSYPKSVYVSETDLNGKDRPQYGKFYEIPVPKTSIEEPSAEKTVVLNENKEALNNVHMNTTRQNAINNDHADNS